MSESQEFELIGMELIVLEMMGYLYNYHTYRKGRPEELQEILETALSLLNRHYSYQDERHYVQIDECKRS